MRRRRHAAPPTRRPTPRARNRSPAGKPFAPRPAHRSRPLPPRRALLITLLTAAAVAVAGIVWLLVQPQAAGLPAMPALAPRRAVPMPGAGVGVGESGRLVSDADRVRAARLLAFERTLQARRHEPGPGQPRVRAPLPQEDDDDIE